MKRTAIVWFRRDLRLSDNAALEACADANVVPVFVWSPDEEGDWPPGAASRWWLHRSLIALDADLRRRGSRLIVRRGPAALALERLALETGADSLRFHRRYEPWAAKQEANVVGALKRIGCSVQAHEGSLLADPSALLNASGRPFQVFTPFYRALVDRLGADGPVPAGSASARMPAAASDLASESIESLGLAPKAPWDRGLRETWTPGEAGANQRLASFLDGPVSQYADRRDRPDLDGVSRLSPHLHFGEIGPRQVWHLARQVEGSEPFVRQLAWREFSYHLLHHFPETPLQPLRPEFADFPWEADADALRAWQRGLTGFPIVDAGMRQLWAIGWMHNRVRMLAASFLTKDLLIPWQDGTRWFWDTLVDADLANNTQGWQWTAGCGADAAPYFRIFNPVTQAMKFDPDGTYVRAWVPELGRMPAEWIHRPWEAPAAVLRDAAVTLGETYPGRIVDHASARDRALDAHQAMRQGALAS